MPFIPQILLSYIILISKYSYISANRVWYQDRKIMKMMPIYSLTFGQIDMGIDDMHNLIVYSCVNYALWVLLIP